MKPLPLAILSIFLTITLNAYGQTCPPLTGCLDPTFGSGGTLAISVPTTGAVPRHLVTQSDGKVVALIGNRSNSSTYYLMRTNANGSVDTSFGNNGLVTATSTTRHM